MGFRPRAELALKRAREEANRIDQLWAVRVGRAQMLNAAEREEIYEARDSFRLYADSAVLFSALAIESVLNLYGVVRLGEKFYQAHYERLGLVAKFSALVATCLGQLVEKDDEHLKVLSRVSTLRNALAHPKAREIKTSLDLAPSPTRLDHAVESVALMTQFLKMFNELDPNAAWIASSA